MESNLILKWVVLFLAVDLAAGVGCPLGWKTFKSYCYLFNSANHLYPGQSWKNARLSCQVHGADLVDIRDKSENDFVFKSQTLSLRFQHFWIGISDLETEGVYKFVDGTNATYFNWNKNEPNNYLGNEDCVETHYDGTYNDNICTKQFGYICKKKIGAPTPTPPTLPPRPTGGPVTQCEPGWIGFNLTCYLFVEHLPATFKDAREDCQERGGDLVMPKTREVQAFVTSRARLSYRDFWIGLTDTFKEGTFYWIDGTPLNSTLANWAPREPSNSFGGEDCVLMFSRYVVGKWNDNHCLSKQRYICQKLPGKTMCPDGWNPFQEHCYQFNVHPAQPLFWAEARKACLAYTGGDLVSITSKEENKMVLKTLQGYGIRYAGVWLGLNDNKTRGVFEWSDGTAPIKYTNWANNHSIKDTRGNTQCVRGLVRDYRGVNAYFAWQSTGCTQVQYYICKKHREYGRCHNPLGMENFLITNEQITASSSRPLTPPYAGRWNHPAHPGLDGAWCPASTDRFPYLQIDLGKIYKIQFIGLQGKASSKAYVSSYYLMYGTDGVRWSYYGYNPPKLAERLKGVDLKNVETGNIVELKPPVVAKLLRLKPSTSVIAPCMRVEISGCKADFETSCGKNWDISYTPNICYKFSSRFATWTAARAACLSQGGDLLSITSNTEQAFLNKKLNNYKGRFTKFWIGLNDRDNNRVYRWSDGSPMPYINWGRRGLSVKAKDCGGVMTSGTWFEETCYTKLPYICKRQVQGMKLKEVPFNSNWLSGTNHYWPLNEVKNGKIAGTREGKALGTFKINSSFMNRKHLVFDGTNYLQMIDFKQSCISVPQNCYLGLTVSFLLKLPNKTKIETSKRYILDIAGQNAKDALGWSVYLQGTNLGVFLKSTYRTYDKFTSVKFGEWMHVSFTWYLTYGLQIYVNGLQKVFDKYGRGYLKSTNEDVVDLFVGRSATSTAANVSMEMMSLALWERALGVNEIQQIFRAEMRKCGPGWIPFGQYCYQFENKKQSWTVASVYCQSQGGQLASITSGVEQAFITLGVGSAGIFKSAWIGINSRQLNHAYNWTDGNPILYTNWASGEPNNMFGYRREDCGDVRTSGMWNDERCYFRKPLICKKEKDVLPSTPVDKSSDGKTRTVTINQYSVGEIACPLGTSIIVKSATYGYYLSGCKADVKSIVQKICAGQKKFNCFIKSSNDVFNDPCIGKFKSFVAIYDCAPDNSFYQDYTIGCPNGWVLHPGGSSCYKLFIETKTWMDARKACRDVVNDGDLVSIGSRAEQVFVTTLLVNDYVNRDIWNGLSDRMSPGHYKWSDNTTVTYSNWFNGQPDDSTRVQSCVKMNLQAGFSDVLFWTDGDCDRKYSFMCEVPKKASTRAPPLTKGKVNGSCSTGWTMVKDSCFMVNGRRLNWFEAKKACEVSGANLASILDHQENEGVLNLLMKGVNKTSIRDAWIGLTDEGIFRGFIWVDGSPVSFTLWDFKEPDSYMNMKACGMIRNNGNWRDAECGVKLPFVCKKAPSLVTVPPITTVVPTPSQDPKICPPGWLWWSGNGMCYLAKDILVDWYAARQACRTERGDLVSIRNKDEQRFLHTLIPRFSNSRIWIGLSDLSNEGGFVWSDGSPVDFLNFEAGQPDDWHGMEDCVELRTIGYWNDVMCSRKFPYICKRHNNSVPVVTTVPPTAGPLIGFCEPGWSHYRNKCYKIISGGKSRRTWKSARDFCRGEGIKGRNSDLASIQASYENAFLNSLAYNVGESLWIGLSDLQVEKTFGWSDQSSVTFTNWKFRQPDNFGNSEDCVELAPFYRFHGKWNDLTCNALRGFICKMDVTLKKPTALPTAKPVCPKNYVEYAGNCYSYKSTPATWDDAREVCRKENAKSELVSIAHAFEQDYVFSFFAEFTTSMWIGFHRMPNDTKYQWSDNKPADYTYWQRAAGSLPSNAKGCTYAYYASHSSGRWMKSTCDKKYPYMCKVTKETDSALKPNYPGTCPPGWYKRNKHCYLFHTKYFGLEEWAVARQKCRNLGASLASIHSKEELDFLHFHVRGHHLSVWIGLNDREAEGRFVWTDGTAFDFTYWDTMEPNNKYGLENCVCLNTHDGKWNDLKCSRPQGYVCKKNLECSKALGMENMTLGDDKINASSFVGQYFPQSGRLNFMSSTVGWCTDKKDQKQFFQVDLGMVTRVTRIAVQGVVIKYKTNKVLSFRLYYSDDKQTWKTFSVAGNDVLLVTNGAVVLAEGISQENGPAGRYFRISPATWTGEMICMKLELYGCQYVCEAPLGLESKVIKDAAINASSSKPEYKASDGRLNIPGGRGWCALSDSEKQWLQVDLGATVQISKVATQGLKMKDGKDSVVAVYKLAYSDDGKSWTYYKAINDEIRIFDGNNHAEGTVFHRFSRSVSGRYVRFYPIYWKVHICMRVEVFGCPLACDQPLGLENGKIKATSIFASTSIYPLHVPDMGRLNIGGSGKGAWCAATNDRQQYLEVDMGTDTRVTAIAMQGYDGDINKYVTDYIIQFSDNGKFWNTYAVGGQIAVLSGNKNGYGVNKIELKAPLHGRYFRVNPKHWKQGICIRMELYGCVLNPGSVPTDEPPPRKRVKKVAIRLTGSTWSSALKDRDSKEFKSLANMIEITITKIYLDPYAFKNGFESVTVTDFRPGSVIADMVILFRSESKVTTDILEKAVHSGKLGDLKVDSSYLKITDESEYGKQSNEEPGSSGLSRAGKIALVVFFILLIATILVFGMFWYWRKRRQTNQFAPKSFDNPVHYSAHTYETRDESHR